MARNETQTGTIDEVINYKTGYGIIFKPDDGGPNSLFIGERETIQGEFITAATGKKIEMKINFEGDVKRIKIDGKLVLQRPED